MAVSKSIVVSNSSELTQALKQADGGETIYLKGGNGSYALDLRGQSFDSTVTLKSLDSKHEAVFSSIKLDQVSNLTVDGVQFDSSGEKRPGWMTDLFVEDSKNITVVNSTMSNTASAFNNGHVTVGDDAVRVKDTNGFVFRDNEVSHYNFGLNITKSDNVEVSGNDLHHLQADGMQFSDVDQVVVEDNYIHDFYASLFSINHNDMIQFFTTGTKSPSEDIVIRDNVLDSGDGNFTQSIFMSNEAVGAGAGYKMYYQDVLIDNNTIYNNNYNGIVVDKADGVTIRDNSLLLNQETPLREFKAASISIVVKAGSRDIVVEDNVAGELNIKSPAKLNDNLTVDYKRPAADNYYLKVLDLDGQKDPAHVDGITLDLDSKLVRGMTDKGDAVGSDAIQPKSGPAEPTPTTPAKPPVEKPAEQVVYGTSRPDRIVGDDGRDALHGGGGDDLMHGYGGDDRLWGDNGNDGLRGETGDDAIYGGSGNDMLWGDAGADVLDGGQGRDNYYGSDGVDTFVLRKGEVQDDRINDYQRGETVLFQGFHDGASVERLGSSLFEVHDTDGSVAEFRMSGVGSELPHWEFA